MREGDCKNFRGIQHDMCKANVDMRKLSGVEPGMLTRIPCLSMHSDRHCIECASYSPHTSDDVAMHEAESKKMLAKFMLELSVLNPLIKRIKSDHKDGGAGSEPCPICNEGEIRYSVSCVNHHIRMSCTSENCVNFIE